MENIQTLSSTSSKSSPSAALHLNQKKLIANQLEIGVGDRLNDENDEMISRECNIQTLATASMIYLLWSSKGNIIKSLVRESIIQTYLFATQTETKDLEGCVLFHLVSHVPFFFFFFL